jgi:hypothetical protein
MVLCSAVLLFLILFSFVIVAGDAEVDLALFKRQIDGS